RDIRHRGWIKAFERGAADLLAARRQVFEPSLVGRDFDALAWPRLAARLLDTLPSLPGEFVIVPNGDEGPPSSCILQVGIGEVTFVDRAVTVDRQRKVELADLPAVRNARD